MEQKKWITKEVQKSLSFIFPYLKIPHHLAIKNSFLGANYMPDVEWGEYFILSVHPTALGSEEFMNTLESHKNFLFKRIMGKYDHHFVFTIPDNIKERVVTPFLNGKYSEIDEDYKNNGYFPKYLTNGEINTNYQILNKSKDLKKVWEYLIDITLPEGCEVWSVPEKEDEIYGFKKRVSSNKSIPAPIRAGGNEGDNMVQPAATPVWAIRLRGDVASDTQSEQ